MNTKKCIGCFKDVEDKIKSQGIATICEDCAIPFDKIPKEVSRKSKCKHCGKCTNFIGAFIKDNMPFLYFDCSNSTCARQRITLKLLVVKRTVILK